MKETDFKTKESKEHKDVIEFYDEYAQSWDNRFGNSKSTNHFLEKRWSSFSKHLPKNTNNLNAVELGVGTGVYIDKAAHLFNSLKAVDGSKNMIQQLDNKLSQFNIKNVTTLISDVCDLQKIESSTVDIVYFFGLIEHIIETEKFISEIHRILKKNGLVIGVTPNGVSPWYKLRKLIRGTDKHCSTDKYYTKSELIKLFLNSEFLPNKFTFWGLVPAGIKSHNIYTFMSEMEPVVENTPLKYFSGGLTFSFRKL